MAAKYKLGQVDVNSTLQYVIRVEDQAFIPNNEENTDYVAYLAWVAEGNVADAADVVEVPAV